MPPNLENQDLRFHRLTFLSHLETGRQAYQTNRDCCVEVPIQPGQEDESRYKGMFTGLHEKVLSRLLLNIAWS
jgi:hypothetical protein